MAGHGTAHLRASEQALLRAEHLVVEFPVGRSGLKVHAELDTSSYPTGTKIPDTEMTALRDTGALHTHERAEILDRAAAVDAGGHSAGHHDLRCRSHRGTIPRDPG